MNIRFNTIYHFLHQLLISNVIYNDNMTQYIITNIKHLVECNILKDINEFQLKSNTDKASFFLDHILGFDKSIYGNRFFRTLYSSKNKEIDNTSYPCDPVTFLCDKTNPMFETWKNHLATWIPNDCQQLSYQNKQKTNNNNDNNNENNKNTNENNKNTNDNNKNNNENTNENNPTLNLSMKLPSSQVKNKKNNNKYQLIQDVIEFLPEKYSTEYDSWIRMGYILKNNLKNLNTKEKNKEYIFTEQNSFNLFLIFSQKSKNADPEPTLKQFFYTLDVKNMNDKELSFGTVFHWAKETRN